MAATQQAPVEIIVTPFGIEADHPRNSDLLLQCVPGARLRSAIDGSKSHIDVKSGEPRVPLDQARHLSSFPRLPGMQIHVNPATCRYEIIDPLHGNAAMCERIGKWLRENQGLSTGNTIKGVPPKGGTLDPHRMKSLCRELYFLLESKEAKVVKGVAPDLEEIEKLPGYFLLNPGIRTGTTQPVYEKDFPGWIDRLSQSGG